MTDDDAREARLKRGAPWIGTQARADLRDLHDLAIATAEEAELEHWHRFRDEAALVVLGAWSARTDLREVPFEKAIQAADAFVAKLRANPWMPPADATESDR